MNATARIGVLMLLGGVLMSAVGWPPAGQNAATRDAHGTVVIRGQVTSENAPVSDAVVRIKGSSVSARTDSAGQFELPSSLGAGRLRITASAPGHLIAGADWLKDAPLRLALQSYDPSDAATYRWAPPHADGGHKQACGNCHGEIVREWAGSAHASSATNRRFFNLYDGTDWRGRENVGWSLRAEYPHGTGVCYSCHVPSLEPDSAAIADLRQTSGVHREGIHCDFCHKVTDVSTEHVGLNHGRFAMRHARPADAERQQLFLGPLDDVDRGEDVYLPLYKESRYCASCHEGVLFGTHAYSTYSEWLASSYAAKGVQCQDCHMAPSGHMTNVAPGKGGIERDARSLATHAFPGGEAVFLRRHAQLVLTARRTAEGVEAVVEVSARGVGHRLPTGHPSRNMILWLEAVDASGRRLPLVSGPRLPPLAGEGSPGEGGLAGEPGRFYAKVLEGLDGSQPVPYWRPNRLAADTRLDPDKTDRQTFLFSFAAGEVRLTARLLYRRFTRFEAEQKGWPDNEIVVAEEQVRLLIAAR